MSRSSSQSLFSVMAAEFKRMFLRPKALVAIALFAAAAVALYAASIAVMNLAVEVAADSPDLEAPPAAATGFMGFELPLTVLSLCLGIHAASLMARDYNDGTLLASLLVVPGRGRLFAARLVPWIIVSAVVSLVVFLLCFVISLNRISDTSIALAQLGLSIVSCVFATILGFCCGTITKKGSLSILAFLALMILIGMALSAVTMALPENVRGIVSFISSVMPSSAFSNMVNIVQPAANDGGAALTACAASVVWGVGLPIVSFILFKKRATLGR